MAMSLPVGGANMNFYIACDAPQFGSNQECRIPKIGAGARVPLARMLHLHAFAVGGEQGFGAQTIIGPDALEMSLAERGRGDGGRFAYAAWEWFLATVRS